MYFVIDKTQQTHKHALRKFDNPMSVAGHMLGRRVCNYMVVKSDVKGDRVVPWPSTDVNEIQQALEQA